MHVERSSAGPSASSPDGLFLVISPERIENDRLALIRSIRREAELGVGGVEVELLLLLLLLLLKAKQAFVGTIQLLGIDCKDIGERERLTGDTLGN